jgi:hypothetical protein
MSEQPMPKGNDERPVWERVIEDMGARDHVGRKRYGVPLQPFNGRDALRDAYEEALDLAVYLKQALLEREEDERRFAEGEARIAAEEAASAEHLRQVREIEDEQAAIAILTEDDR